MEPNLSTPTELNGIWKKFNSLISDFEELKKLSPESAKNTSFKSGVVVKANVNAEAIIKHICKTSVIQVKPNDDKFEPVFNDYILAAAKNKIISKNLKKHFDNIRAKRNNLVHLENEEHYNETHDELTPIELESVRESLTIITDWFFTDYLKNKYPEFSIKKSGDEEINTPYLKQDIRQESVREPASFATTTTNGTKGKAPKIIAISIALAAIIFAVYYFNNDSETKTEENPTASSDTITNSANPMSVNEKASSDADQNALSLLQKYYDALLQDSIDNALSQCLSEDVSIQLLGEKLMDEEQPFDDVILKCKKNADDTYPNINFDIENLKPSGENQWTYIDKLSKIKLTGSSKKKIKIEFTVSPENKIISLKETEEEDPIGGS